MGVLSGLICSEVYPRARRKFFRTFRTRLTAGLRLIPVLQPTSITPAVVIPYTCEIIHSSTSHARCGWSDWTASSQRCRAVELFKSAESSGLCLSDPDSQWIFSSKSSTLRACLFCALIRVLRIFDRMPYLRAFLRSPSLQQIQLISVPDFSLDTIRPS